eukprot:g530.t1
MPTEDRSDDMLALDEKRGSSNDIFVDGYNVHYLLHPSSKYKIAWDLFVAVLIIYSVTVIPQRLGFDMPDPTPGSFADVIDILIDCMFALDMVFCFNVAGVLPDDRLLVDRKEIAITYLRTWFAIDFFSTVPFDRISKLFLDDINDGDADATLRSLKIVKALRLMRLAKLARVLKLGKLVVHIESMNIDPGYLKLLTLFLKIFFISHMICCGWGYIGLYFTENGSGDSWISAYNFQNASKEDTYAASLYWTIATVMSVGYGDIVGIAMGERIYTVFVQTIGACMFGIILVTMGNFADGDPIEFVLSNKRFELKSYMRHNKLPRKLQREIISFYESYWRLKTSINESVMFADLSETLRMKLALHSYEHVVELSPFIFKIGRLNASFVADLVHYLLPRNFSAGDVIYGTAEESEGWYVVKKGIVEAYLTDESTPTEFLSATASFDVASFEEEGGIENSKNGKAVNEGEDEEEEEEESFERDVTVYGFYSLGANFGESSLGENFCCDTLYTSKNINETKTNSEEEDFKWRNIAARAATSVDCFLVPVKDLEPILYLHPTVADLLSQVTRKRFRNFRRVNHFFRKNGKREKIERESEIFGDQKERPIVHNNDLTDLIAVSHIYPPKVSVNIKNNQGSRAQKCLVRKKKDSSTFVVSMCVLFCTTLKRFVEKPSRTQARIVPEKSNFDATNDESDKDKQSMRGNSQTEGPTLITAGNFNPRKYSYRMETVESLRRRWLIFPEWEPKVKWDLFIAAIILYSVVAIPYRITFDDSAEPCTFFWWFDILVDILFGIDIIVSFRTAYFSEEDRVFVAAPDLIAWNYMKTWFAIDFFSTIPIDKIAGSFLDDNTETLGFCESRSETLGNQSNDDNLRAVKLIRTLRLIRLVKLIRLMKLGKVATSIEEKIQNPAILSLGKLLFQVTFVAHLFACFWFHVATGGSPVRSSPHRDSWYIHEGLQDKEKGEQYFASLYWAFTTMTTVGYGDILPQRTDERWYAMMTMVTGASMFGYIVGSIAALSGTFNVGETRRKEKMDALKAFLQQKRVPKELRRTINSYYTLLMSHQSPFNESAILTGLPRRLRFEAFMHIHHKAAKMIRFFHNKPFHIALQLVTAMRPQAFEAGQTIYAPGSQGLDVYFILSGNIEIRVTSDAVKERERKKRDLVNRIRKKSLVLGVLNKELNQTKEKEKKKTDDDAGENEEMQNKFQTKQQKEKYDNIPADERGVMDDNGSMIVHICQPGEHFGHKFIMSAELRDEYAIARTAVSLLVLTKKQMGKLLSQDLDVASVLQLLVRGDDMRYIKTQRQDIGYDERLFEERRKELNQLVLQMSPAHRQIVVREKMRERAYKLVVTNSMQQSLAQKLERAALLRKGKMKS